MPTKANKGGVFLYISNKLNYKAKNKLQINIDKKPASIFIEVLSKSQKNLVISCIYKHPNLAVT